MPIASSLAVLLLALSPEPAAVAPESCVVHSAAQRTRLVELYTSEGCSSCPPAEAWLRTLPADARLVPLAFHVDYWDDLGWRDAYADPRYAARQRELAARSGSAVVYTPEVALDGREWRAWRRDAVPAANEPARAVLTLRVAGADTLRVHLAAVAAQSDPAWRGFIALTEGGLTTQVRAGENRGKALRHEHVVRAFAGPFALDAVARATLPVPPGLVAANAAVVAFVQHAGSGEVIQVVRTPLACLSGVR